MLLYFDTSIFLRGYKEEKEEKYRECIDGIADIMSEFEAGKLQIVTSAITMAEIMPKRTGEFAYEKIISVLGRMYVHPADRRIAESAARLRDFLHRKNLSGSGSDEQDNDSKLKTPDAIHLATAIFMQAKYLCTTDKELIKHGNNLMKGVEGKRIKVVRPPLPELPMSEPPVSENSNLLL